jgi:hypothetical protein
MSAVWSIFQRKENIKADALSKFTSFEKKSYAGSSYFQVLKTPTIDSKL